MKIKKKDIKTGHWVCLDGMPWFPDAYARGDDKRTLADMRNAFPVLYDKVAYYKVVRVKPTLTCEWRRSGQVYRETFYIKWVTDVQPSYKNVIKARESIQ